MKIKLILLMLLGLSISCAQLRGKPKQEGIVMYPKNSLYLQLSGKSRPQIIEMAVQEIKKVLNDVDLSPYREVRVWKTSKYVRVKFDSNIAVAEQEMNEQSESPIRAQSLGSSITFVSSEKNNYVQPNDSKYLFKYTKDILAIAKTFDLNDTLSFADKGESFQVRVSHPSTAEQSGGSELYLINKKTLSREMLQHEHPQKFENNGIETGLDGKPYVDPDPEVEMIDPK